MMLPARVEAAARLDPEAFDGGVTCSLGSCQPRTQLGRQAARRGDAKLARVGAGAGRDIGHRPGAGLPKTDRLQFAVESGEIGFADPAHHDVLFHRRPRTPERNSNPFGNHYSRNTYHHRCSGLLLAP